MRYWFRDLDANGTLNRGGEYIDVLTYIPSQPTSPQITWRIEVDTAGMTGTPITPPAAGDVYTLALSRPFTAGDVFRFTTTAEKLSDEKAREEFAKGPYVVPNPYVGAASFEPERFAVSGRGVRRMEFRNLPARCTVRIFTVRGDLVQTLTHDGSNEGYVAWDLRSKDNLEVAPGLYVFHVDGGTFGSHIGKFAIIK